MNLERQIEDAKSGDSEAFGCLYDAYYLKMRGVCIKIIKADNDDVNDLVHDAFILAFASLGQLRDPKRFGEWLTTITTNIALKYLHRLNRISSVPLSSVSDEDLNVTDSASMSESKVLREELFTLINKLPEGYRKVFYMSVIEGFSHKEIADMLGIEPHSSSSQLARAKTMLRKMLTDYRWPAVVIFAILLWPVYRYFTTREPGAKDYKRVAKEEKKATNVEKNNVDTNVNAQPVRYVARYNIVKGGISSADTCVREVLGDTTRDVPVANAEMGQMAIARSHQDSTGMGKSDSLHILTPSNNTDVTTVPAHKQGKWKMLVAGSLGPALAQNVYKLISTVGDVSSGGPSPVMPDKVGTWEDYYKYLLTTSTSGMPADFAALIDIAKNNSGEIIERENHEKPVTFGLSLTKTLSDRWSLETGLQYSLLQSSFVMGGNAYNIQKNQKIHYLGIPLRLSYRIVGYKNLSAYGAAGFIMNVPVNGSIKETYVTDTNPVYADRWHLTPPVQWSVNTSIGVQYKLTPSLSLYLEPTLNYYIPTGSSAHTVWTEHPFTVTMPFGIRFTW